MGLKSIIKGLIRITREKEIAPIVRLVDENETLAGRVALIAGGTGGIGLAIAKSYLSSGCSVIIAGTNSNKLNDSVCKLKEIYAERINSIVIDFYNIDSFEDKVNEAISMFGKIDIFVNSVGVHTNNADFWDMTVNEYDRVLNINLRGMYFMCQVVARYMRSNRIRGYILLISSSRGSEPAWSPYGISKWGLNGLTKGLAQRLSPYGIIVNAIAPGSTATELIGVMEGDNIYTEENKVNRLIMPDEVADLARMLVSGAGDMIIGETIHISGGRGLFDIR